MKSLGQVIVTAKAPQKPVPDKEILWAAQNKYGDLPSRDFSKFPNIIAIKDRFKSTTPSPLNLFGEAIANAQERIWIIDHYFLEPDKDKGLRSDRVKQITDWLLNDSMKATDIKILTDELKEKGSEDIGTNQVINLFQECADLLNENRKSDRSGKCKIEVRFKLDQIFPYVHDRFAIIDDELWHFGATVGGFHAQVSAATRGWRASDHNTDAFFESAWSKEHLMGKKR